MTDEAQVSFSFQEAYRKQQLRKRRLGILANQRELLTAMNDLAQAAQLGDSWFADLLAMRRSVAQEMYRNIRDIVDAEGIPPAPPPTEDSDDLPF